MGFERRTAGIETVGDGGKKNIREQGWRCNLLQGEDVFLETEKALLERQGKNWSGKSMLQAHKQNCMITGVKSFAAIWMTKANGWDGSHSKRFLHDSKKELSFKLNIVSICTASSVNHGVLRINKCTNKHSAFQNTGTFPSTFKIYTLSDSMSMRGAALWVSVFAAGWVIGECPGPRDNSQHLRDVLITTCHPNCALIPSQHSESAGGVWSTADNHKSERRVKDSGRHPPFAGPQSCWTSFHRRCRFWTSCRRPCSWWWAGGRRSAVVPSSRLMPSGWVAGSSCPPGHYCTLTFGKKKKKHNNSRLELK